MFLEVFLICAFVCLVFVISLACIYYGGTCFREVRLAIERRRVPDIPLHSLVDDEDL